MKFAFPLARPLATAGLILAAAMLFKSNLTVQFSPELTQRFIGVLLGLIVVVYANRIPKALPALSQLRGSAAGDQAARRFFGRALVLGGLGYVLAAMLAPLASMHLIGGTAMGVALLAALLRCSGCLSRRAPG